jgi:hypothetical protein
MRSPTPTRPACAVLALVLILGLGCSDKTKSRGGSGGSSSSTTGTSGDSTAKDVKVVVKDGLKGNGRDVIPKSDAAVIPKGDNSVVRKDVAKGDNSATRKDGPAAKNVAKGDGVVALKDGPLSKDEPTPKKVTLPDWSKVSAQEWKAGETQLLSAEQAKDYVPGTLRVSPDRAHVAYGKKLGDREVMVLDGKELVPLAKIDSANIVFSADSNHIIYSGSKSKDAEYTIVKDKQSWLTNNGGFPVNSFVINDDASEVGAYVGVSVYLLINERPLTGNLLHAGKKKIHYANLFNPGQILVDGKELKKFEYTSEFQFSRNGESYAFIVSQSGEMFVAFNGEEQRAYQKIDSLSLSPDGKRFAHRADHGGKQYLIIDGKPKPYAGKLWRKVLFSPDSKRWATVLDNKVIVDHASDAPIGPPDQYNSPIDANSLTFSPDSRHYAYFGTLTGLRVVVLDGQELGRYEAVAKTPTFSPDGRSMAYLAQAGRDGKWTVYINGKKHADVPYDPNSRSVLEFSPDGKSIGYAGSVDLVWHILLDGKLLEKNDEIGPEGTPIGFAPDGSFTYLVKRKGAYYRVVEKRQ